MFCAAVFGDFRTEVRVCINFIAARNSRPTLHDLLALTHGQAIPKSPGMDALQLCHTTNKIPSCVEFAVPPGARVIAKPLASGLQSTEQRSV